MFIIHYHGNITHNDYTLKVYKPIDVYNSINNIGKEKHNLTFDFVEEITSDENI